MNRRIPVTVAVLMAVTASGFSQETVSRTETTHVRTTYGDAGYVTETRTEVVTIVEEYVTYLRDVYSELGLEEEVIVRLLRIDVEILEAWARYDFGTVETLFEEQVEILGPRRAATVVTYVHRRPPPAVLPIFARPAWSFAVVEERGAFDLRFDRDRIRHSLQRSDFEPRYFQGIGQRVNLRTGQFSAPSEMPVRKSPGVRTTAPGLADDPSPLRDRPAPLTRPQSPGALSPPRASESDPGPWDLPKSSSDQPRLGRRESSARPEAPALPPGLRDPSPGNRLSGSRQPSQRLVPDPLPADRVSGDRLSIRPAEPPSIGRNPVSVERRSLGGAPMAPPMGGIPGKAGRPANMPPSDLPSHPER